MSTIKSIPSFNDNYIWLIVDSLGHTCVIDPGDATPVLEVIKQQSLTLTHILVTHHHRDHTDGIDTLKQHFPNVAVFGPKHDPVTNLTQTFVEGDHFELFGEHFDVIDLPGHTLGHIGYYCSSWQGVGALFCGDVLFSGGCGRVFEGTYAQMYDSLNKLATLPDTTQIYPAHEYTLANLAFAAAVEPNNTFLLEHLQQCQEQRQQQKATLPSTMATELKINPFLRLSATEIIEQAVKHGHSDAPLAVFSYLRDWKNDF